MAQTSSPLLFTEKRSNIILMGIALAVALAGAVTLLLLGYRQDQLATTVPIVVVLAIWSMILAGNIHYRRRISPILRLEASRIRYIGGPLFAPRLHEVALDDIEAIERTTASVIRIRLKGEKRRKRSIPVGLLAAADRKRFDTALRERLAL